MSQHSNVRKYYRDMDRAMRSAKPCKLYGYAHWENDVRVAAWRTEIAREIEFTGWLKPYRQQVFLLMRSVYRMRRYQHQFSELPY